jgi:hypothetical protein
MIYASTNGTSSDTQNIVVSVNSLEQEFCSVSELCRSAVEG